MTYYFILGKNPILSKAEIEAVLELKNLRFQISDFSDKVLILETEKELDIAWLNQRLGGTVKIGKIIGNIETFENFDEIFIKKISATNGTSEAKLNSTSESASGGKAQPGKFYFGFSLYALTKTNPTKYLKQLTRQAMEIKRKLKEEKEISSRYVVSKEVELSSVIVEKNKLLKNGAEICFFIKDKEILFGQTLAVQPFFEFGQRDFGRPNRDDVSGMIPPKLAKIMINLAQLPEESVILDPFCGSGTILQEALLMGYQNLLGFDNSDKAISNSQNNLAWLTKNFKLTAENIKLKKVEVNNLSAELKLNSIDAIITEPFLGPPLKGNEKPGQIDKISQELTVLYSQALQEFTKILKSKGKIILISPIYQIFQQSKSLPIESLIKNLPLKILNQEQLIYSRPNQHLWREILILQK